MTLDETLQQAITHHKAGRIQEAERLYRAILQIQPNHPDANHNIGVLAIQVKQPAAGLPHLKVALETNPNQSQYWLSYIEGLIQTDQTDSARQVLIQGRQRGLQGEVVETLAARLETNRQDPGQSNAASQYHPKESSQDSTTASHNSKKNTIKPKQIKPNRSAKKFSSHKTNHPGPQEMNTLVTLFNKKRYQEVTTLARELTIRFPQHGFAWGVLGTVLKTLGLNSDALEPMQKAALFSPNDAGVHYNLGIILNDLGRPTEAESSYRRALQIKPDFAEALNNLANTLKALERPADSEAGYRQALQIKPNYAEAHNNLGNVLQDLGRTNEAETEYRQALRFKPDYAEAYNNLGNVLQDLRRTNEAESAYLKALQIKPDYGNAHYNLGNVFKDTGRSNEALAHYKRSLQSKGDWKESLCRLTTPLILSTGMAYGPQYEPDCTETGNPANTYSKQTDPLGSPDISMTANQELHSLAVDPPQPIITKNLRIVLIYPPPWQIQSPGEPITGMPFGPPKDRRARNLDDTDFQTIPYGLLTIAAQARRSGYVVSVYNLSVCPWRDVITLIADTEADVFGISAFTANRRGMGAVASLIRQHHPKAHIMAGGPFVTALPQDTLRYYQDIDTAVIGEGEDTFMELIRCIEAGKPTAGIPGTAYRNGEEIIFGPNRPRIKDLDSLAPPFDYFASPIVMTSRGCPNKCTFCGSYITWGKMMRFHSAEYCIDIFNKALTRLPVPFLAIKDDTFTAHRRRTLMICDTIIRNKMNFVWSCDSRVDSIDDELLYKMRLAGCQMISLGVESGSPEILKTIRKEITPDMVLEATRSAKKYGMYVRYYMIYGNRGETFETIQQSNQLIKSGRPNRYISGPLSFFPGTEDWSILCEKEGFTPDIFFRNDFKELSIATNRQQEFQHVMLHITCDIGAVHGFDYEVAEREAIVDRLPHLHMVYVELANAYFRAGRLDEADSALNRAKQLNFPIDTVIYNQRACITMARGHIEHALTILEKAFQSCPSQIVLTNINTLRAWIDVPVNNRGNPPMLNDSVDTIDFCTHLFGKG